MHNTRGAHIHSHTHTETDINREAIGQQYHVMPFFSLSLSNSLWEQGKLVEKTGRKLAAKIYVRLCNSVDVRKNK